MKSINLFRDWDFVEAVLAQKTFSEWEGSHQSSMYASNFYPVNKNIFLKSAEINMIIVGKPALEKWQIF